ncbi:MAG: helix-turn-helix domain-containing protein [candidate division WOR-3 bacterium]
MKTLTYLTILGLGIGILVAQANQPSVGETEINGQVVKVQEITSVDNQGEVIQLTVQTKEKETIEAWLCPRWYLDSDIEKADGAMKDLLRYNFPGNVRELENIIERAVVFSKEEYIQKDDLPNLSATKIKDLPKGKLNEVIDKIEKELIEESLKNNDWNQTKAAAELGISERSCVIKLKDSVSNHKNNSNDPLLF